MQDELDRLAAALGRGVSLDSPDGRLLGYSVQADDADDTRIAAILTRQVPAAARTWQDEHRISTATAPVHLPANEALQMSARLCVPLRESGSGHGYLWVLESRAALSEAEIERAADAGARIVRLLTGGAERGGAGVRLAGLLQLLTAPATPEEAERHVDEMVEVAPQLRNAEVRLVVGAPVPEAPGHGAEFTPKETVVLERLLARLIQPGGGLVTGVARADRFVALRLQATDADHVGAGLRAGVGTLLADGRLTVGTGPAVPFSAPHLLRGHAQARLAAECVAADPRLSGEFELSWDRLGLYQLFLGKPDLTAWQSPLQRLSDAEGSGSMLLDTLEAYLDLAGDAQRTASTLNLHRTTLYYRLRRIVDLLDGDLGDGMRRTQLHVAVKSRRLSRARALAPGGPGQTGRS